MVKHTGTYCLKCPVSCSIAVFELLYDVFAHQPGCFYCILLNVCYIIGVKGLRHKVCKYRGMKQIVEKRKHIHSRIVEWVLFKGPELFVTLYS